MRSPSGSPCASAGQSPSSEFRIGVNSKVGESCRPGCAFSVHAPPQQESLRASLSGLRGFPHHRRTVMATTLAALTTS